ncbi:MAG: DUF4271 domain-containing protein [Prevotella sp.]|nr:DUF4271 domain-containing protein [Candidatus Prevotella equi]
MQTDSVLYETFVKHTPYYHAEISGVRDGQAGEPLSYSIVSDDYVGIGFLLCLIVSALSVAKSWRFVCFQTKNLLRMPRANSFEMRETLNEMQYQAYFWLQGMAMYALLAYVVAKEYVAQEYVVDDYGLLGLFFAVIAIGFLLRYVVATIVHLVFFPKSERHMSSISRIYIIAVQGALMLPIMLLNVYYGLGVEKTLYVWSL